MLGGNWAQLQTQRGHMGVTVKGQKEGSADAELLRDRHQGPQIRAEAKPGRSDSRGGR